MVRTAEEAEHWLQEAEGVIAKEAGAPSTSRASASGW